MVVPYREEMAKRHLKVTGDLGKVTFIEYDLRNTQSIEEAVRHSDVVYNLVGRMYPTKYVPKGRCEYGHIGVLMTLAQELLSRGRAC